MKDRVGGQFTDHQSHILDQAREPMLDEVNSHELAGSCCAGKIGGQFGVVRPRRDLFHGPCLPPSPPLRQQ